MSKFILDVTQLTIAQENPLKKADFNLLLQSFIEELKSRNELWVNKLRDLSSILGNIVKTFKDNKFLNFNEVLSVAKGDNGTLIQYMNSAIQLPTSNKTEEVALILDFKMLNPDVRDVQEFETL